MVKILMENSYHGLIRAPTHTHMYVYMYRYIYRCICMCICMLYMYTYVQIHTIHIHMYRYMYMYLYMYTYAHTHTHTHVFFLKFVTRVLNITTRFIGIGYDSYVSLHTSCYSVFHSWQLHFCIIEIYVEQLQLYFYFLFDANWN